MTRYRPNRLAWLVIAACGPPGPPLSGGTAANRAEAPTAALGPAPTVRWADRDFTTTGLPAIASDGSAIVIAHRDNDGGRGNPNLTLIEKDRADRVVHRRVVLSPNDLDYLDPAEIASRFERATAWLRERHDAHHLVALTALALDEPDLGAPPPLARGPRVTLRWTPNQLVIEREREAALVRATPRSWLAADHPMCSGCREICHNEAFLGGGYVDLARSTAVVVVSYRGTDTCWEPSSEHHVVAW